MTDRKRIYGRTKSRSSTHLMAQEPWLRRQLDVHSYFLDQISNASQETASIFSVDRSIVQGASNIPVSNSGYARTSTFGTNKCISQRSSNFPSFNPGYATHKFGTDRSMHQGSSNILCSNPGSATNTFGTDTSVLQNSSNYPCFNPGYATTTLFGTNINNCTCQAPSGTPKEVEKAPDPIHGIVNYYGGVFYYDKGSLHCKYRNTNDQTRPTDFNDKKNLLPYGLKLPYERSSIPSVVPKNTPKETSSNVFMYQTLGKFDSLHHKVSVKNSSKIKVKSYSSIQKSFPGEFNKPLRSSLYEMRSDPVQMKWVVRSKLNPAINVMNEIPLSYYEVASHANSKFNPPSTIIVQNRSDYFTIPSLDELIELINYRQQSCTVQNFTIGRKGYGQVMFPGSLDVLGLNIDETVHFETTEIVVYPEGVKKPPIGYGLNRRALITLYGVKPDNFHSADNYHEELRRVSILQGTKFIEYSPQTTSWVFEVDHFSKYGLSCFQESKPVASDFAANIEHRLKID